MRSLHPLNKMKYLQIEDTVNKLFEKYNLKELPVDVENFARFVNLDIFYRDIHGCNKVVLVKPNYLIISNFEDEIKKRIEIAHVIGHYVIHSKLSHRIMEIHHKIFDEEADHFVRALLIPLISVNLELSREDMINIYKVDRCTLDTRLSDLGCGDFNEKKINML